ncbi:MAG: hypothetical protein QOH68_2183 [Nocardioidaceae bacterium]|jgi:DNA-binding NarL/FixJ family response regulator|nr:hypothetical protein [Nocardioidaceae bacterium]
MTETDAPAVPEHADLRRAEALAVGEKRYQEAMLALDGVLADGPSEHFADAVRIAGAVNAHRGMLQQSADIYGHVAPEDLGDAAADAVVALLGVGDLARAEPMLAASRVGSPTMLATSRRAAARGLELSLSGDGAESVPALLQAAATVATTGDVVLPDTAAALAALVACHLGDLDLAESVLIRADAAGIGGPAFAARHRLLLGWVAMLRGDLTRASELASSVETSLDELRDGVFAHALRVGIARRRSDVASLAESWAAARALVVGSSVDLFLLLPLGELLVGSARLRDDHRLAPQVREATELLDRLGRPALWSTSFHWYGVQAAIVGEQPDRLLPHADAITASATVSRHAALLASVGRTWIDVLKGEVDPTAVHQAVADLISIGLTWDASRLAAHAALRTTDRRANVDLLNAARAAQRPSTESESAQRGHGLTQREWEVAQLVVQGVEYREIGARLFISPKTVEHHVASVRRRLGSASRSDMIETLRVMLQEGRPSDEES